MLVRRSESRTHNAESRNFDVLRLKWADMAKGYGIILVMVGHLAQYTVIGGIIYSFHIPLFFFISGYFFKDTGTIVDFLKSGLKKFIIPYFCLSVPMILWDAFVSKGGYIWAYAPFHDVKNLSAAGIIVRDVLGLILQRRMWTCWFLASLFVSQLIFRFLLFLKRFYLLLVVILISAFGFLYVFWEGPALIWNADISFTTLPFFYVGFLCKKKNISFREDQFLKKTVAWLTLSALSVLTAFLNYAVSGRRLDIYHNSYGFLPFMFIAAFSGIVSTIIFSGFFYNRFIGYIGANSLIYFFWHQNLMIPIVSRLLVHLNILQGDGPLEFWLRTGVTVLLMCIFLTLVNLVITKTPLRIIVGKSLWIAKKTAV